MASRGKQGNRNSQGDFMLVDEEGREDIDFPPNDEYMERMGKQNLENLKDQEDEEPIEKDIEELKVSANKIISEGGEGSTKVQISFVLNGLIDALNGEDTGGFGTKKEEAAILTELVDLYKNAA